MVLWNAAAIQPVGCAASTIAHDFFDRRAHVDLPRVGIRDFERITCIDSWERARLQFDSGLGFEIDLVAHADDASHRIE